MHASADALLIALRPAHAMLALRRRGRETPLGQFGANQDGLIAAAATLRSRPRHVVLRLETGSLLERTRRSAVCRRARAGPRHRLRDGPADAVHRW